jgi:hypothetical protein
MKYKLSVLTLIYSSSLIFSPLFADDMSDLKKQLQLMQQQMQQQMQQIQKMQAKIEEQDERLKEQQASTQQIVESSTANDSTTMGSTKTLANELVNSLAISGEIAVNTRASSSHEYNNEGASDVILDTLAMGFDAQITSWVNGHIYFLYNQDPGPGAVSDELHVDEASITIGNSEVTPFYLTAGRMYVPFGNFESHMVSDPMTLVLGETREEAIQIGMNLDNGLYGSAYLFNGRILTQKNDHKSTRHYNLDNYGANLGYAFEQDNYNLDLGIGYINNIATSDAIQDTVFEKATCDGEDCIDNYIGGISLHAIANIEDYTLIGEYVSALDNFKPYEITEVSDKKLKPNAWNIEAAYNYTLFGKDTSIAVGYQGSDDFYLDASNPDFYNRAWLVGLNMDIFKNTTISLEWRHAMADSKVKDLIKLDEGDYADEDRFQLKMSVVF